MPRIIKGLFNSKEKSKDFKIYMQSFGIYINNNNNNGNNNTYNSDCIISLTYNDIKNVVLSTKEPYEVDKNLILKRNEIKYEKDYFKEFKYSYDKYNEVMIKNKPKRSHFLIYLTVKNNDYTSQITLIMSDGIYINIIY